MRRVRGALAGGSGPAAPPPASGASNAQERGNDNRWWERGHRGLRGLVRVSLYDLPVAGPGGSENGKCQAGKTEAGTHPAPAAKAPSPLTCGKEKLALGRGRCSPRKTSGQVRLNTKHCDAGHEQAAPPALVQGAVNQPPGLNVYRCRVSGEASALPPAVAAPAHPAGPVTPQPGPRSPHTRPGSPGPGGQAASTGP